MTYPRRMITKTAFTPTGPAYNGSAPGIWRLDEVAYWIKQGVWPNPSIIPDQYFSYVTMLMSTTATNAQQNNTFLDSSTNNFTITRNGNTTQGGFNPYGADWAGYFDGSGDYFTVPYTTANFDWYTAGVDFTIECWINLSALSVSGFGQPLVVGNYDYGSSTNYWSFGPLANGTVQFYYFNGSQQNVTSTATITTNSWNHIAMTKTSSGITVYVNGVAGTTTAISGTPQSSTGTPLGVGGFNSAVINGYVSNLRIVRGTAIYSGNFTVPTAPLTAVTNTKLLTCQSNRFRDASTNNLTLTVTGNTAVTPFSPFSPAYPGYTAAANGGSAYMDGSGDDLRITYSSTMAAGTGAYSVEAWVYLTSSNTYQGITGTSSDGFCGFEKNAGFWGYYFGTTGQQSTTPCVLYQWNHLVVCRDGSGNGAFFVNGVRAATFTDTANKTSFGNLIFGFNGVGGGQYMQGYATEYRYVKGANPYNPSSATVTIPTSPVTAVTGTVALMSCTNAGIFDGAAINNMETVGSAQVSTTQAKFGTTSVYVPSGGGCALIPNSQPLVLGSGNWTVEFWAYTDASGTKVYFDALNAANTTFQMEIYSSGTNLYWVKLGGSVAITATGALTANTWQHIAVTKSGSSTRLFVNGTQVGSTYTDTDTYDSARWEIGGRANLAYPIVGYIDDLRITKGVARYTATFTPPTQAFPTY